jgi:hypothetical protein
MLSQTQHTKPSHHRNHPNSKHTHRQRTHPRRLKPRHSHTPHCLPILIIRITPRNNNLKVPHPIPRILPLTPQLLSPKRTLNRRRAQTIPTRLPHIQRRRALKEDVERFTTRRVVAAPRTGLHVVHGELGIPQVGRGDAGAVTVGVHEVVAGGGDGGFCVGEEDGVGEEAEGGVD